MGNTSTLTPRPAFTHTKSFEQKDGDPFVLTRDSCRIALLQLGPCCSILHEYDQYLNRHMP